ncbi:MAG TPA: outer membrane beta-barrel protein [Pirellulales bacterium]|jgi:hypothetical protein
MNRSQRGVVLAFAFALCVLTAERAELKAQEPLAQPENAAEAPPESSPSDAVIEEAPEPGGQSANPIGPEVVGQDPSGESNATGRYYPSAARFAPVNLVDPYNRLFPQGGLFSVRGWVNGGVLGNTSNPASQFNGPYNATEVDNGQLNQLYLITEKTLASDGSFSLGARADVLYGSDFFLAQSSGFELRENDNPRWNDSQYSGLALPQLYGEVGTNETSAKIGHFYTVVGYEGVQAPTNFFYSHSYSYMFAGPFTNWGALGNRKWGNWNLQAGMVNGWNHLSEPSNHGAFLGNLKYTGERGGWWSSFAIITGQEQNNLANLPTVVNGYANRTRYSFLVSKNLGSRTEYVFHHWLGTQATGAPGGGTAMWYGIDQYVYYRLADNWRLGTRVEWFRDEDGTRVGLTQPSNPNKAPLPGSYASWTVGVNWTPLPNVLVRPELRWDTYNGPAKPFDDGLKTYQLLLGVDGILQF